MKQLKTIIIILLAFLLLVGCSTESNEEVKTPVTIATMLDSEGSILGQMIMQVLNANGIETVDRINFGTPDILRSALENGEVDLVVDYTGSGQYYHPEDATDTTIWNDPIKGYEFTAKLDLEKKNIVWLTPAPANNTESIAVKREFSEEYGIVNMEQLAAYINAGNDFKLIAAASFIENQLGLLGFEEAYGFKLTNDQIISLSSGNTTEMLKALSESTNGVNASLVYGTDGALDKLNLVVLEDPKHIPPVYLPAPVIRKEVLDNYPEIETLLKPIFESLSLEVLQSLNAKVAYDGEDAASVAKAYLEENNFIQ
jgi:osmoprotectant transport system substrate-binding protein